MANAQQQDINRRIDLAKISILTRYPFYGHLLAGLKFVEKKNDKYIKTMATDGRHIFYNPDFVSTLSNRELIFVIAHEILHCVYNHIGRRGKRRRGLWNKALDVRVNVDLVKDRVGEMPGRLIFYDSRFENGDWYAEAIYEVLYKESKDQKNQQGENGNGDGGSGNGDLDDDYEFDYHFDSEEDAEDGDAPTISAEERQILEEEMKGKILNAAEAARKYGGHIPAGVKRWIEELEEAKLNWKEILANFMKGVVKTNFGKKMHKKSWAKGMFIPSLINEPGGTGFIAIDASGSISNRELKAFLSEVRGALQAFTDFSIKVCSFDTKVYSVKEFTPQNLYEIEEYEVRGGGGTDFMSVFNYLQDNNIRPERLVVLTDGYPCGEWGIPDYCPTLFVITTKNIKAPFGESVYLDPES